MKREKETIVYVTWVDPFSIDEWTDRETLPMEPSYISTVGHLVSESKSCIAVSPNVGDDRIDNPVSCTTIIPKRCIVSCYKVKKTVVKKHDF